MMHHTPGAANFRRCNVMYLLLEEWGKFTRSFILFYFSRCGIATKTHLVEKMNPELNSSISTLIRPMLSDDGIELVDIEYESISRRKVLRLLIHKPGGVTIEDCQYVSRLIEPVLAVNELLVGDDVLEVASPGLDRPLKTESDFRRAFGHAVKIITNSPINSRNQFVGEVNRVENGIVELIDASSKRIQIPLSQIAKAQLEIEF
ncbi:TPA: ribosome maturation factor RimP [Candidatus Poribacteria bacterium]|nr:ribosome maturation factor RimP [Candidatus Poribacteria bacterium]